MKYATDRPCANSEKAARRLTEHAQAFEPIQEGRIYIENQRPVPVRRQGHARGIQRRAELAISRGWLELHESGAFVTQSGAELCA